MSDENNEYFTRYRYVNLAYDFEALASSIAFWGTAKYSDGHHPPRSRRLSKVWWSWCEARVWPVVQIMPRAKYATVEADMIMLPAPAIRDEMLTPIHALFEEHCVGGWWSSCTSYVYASRVPIPIAPFVAERIVSLLWAALKLPERTTE